MFIKLLDEAVYNACTLLAWLCT